MKSLLGRSIDNAFEHHAVINVKVGVQENFSGMHGIVNDTVELAEEQKMTINSIPVGNIQDITRTLQQREQVRIQNMQDMVYQLQVDQAKAEQDNFDPRGGF